jgi:hypothetical protein
MPKQAPASTDSDQRVSKTWTLPALLIKHVAYFRIERGFTADSYALEHLLRAGIAAEERAEREAKAEKKSKAA